MQLKLTAEEKLRIETSGFSAYFDGLQELQNPFVLGSREGWIWATGWMKAWSEEWRVMFPGSLEPE